MAVAETARLVLYAFQWVWTVVVLGVIPSQLVGIAPLADGTGNAKFCKLNWTVGLSRCNFGIAWAAIAFSVLTIAVAWHCLNYCASISLPSNIEMVFFGWLTLWWFVGAITLSAIRKGKAVPGATIVVAFSWMLFCMSLVSAVIAGRAADKKAQAFTAEANA